MKHSLFDVLINSNAFFQDAMNEKENLKIPALIVLAGGIIGAASGYIMEGPAAQMMGGIMPGMGTIILLSTIIIAPLATFIVWIIWAGVIYALSLLFKGKGTFKRTLEVVGYGYLPQIFGGVMTLIVSFNFIPKVKVPQLSAGNIQDPQVIQDTMKALMHDPAMMILTQIVSIISIVFLLWSANIWIFGIKHSRQLPIRDAAICVLVPVVGYILYVTYTSTVM